MKSAQSCSLLVVSCSNHKQTQKQDTFEKLSSSGARSFHECLTPAARALLFERRNVIRALLKGDQERLYNTDQKGGFRDERPTNRKLAQGPEFGGIAPQQTIYLSAYRRYSDGRFYSRLAETDPTFWQRIPESVEIIIVSALYGLLFWDEPIQDYDCHFADCKNDAQRTSVKYIWGDALTQILGDFLNHRSPPVERIYDLLSESIYQSVLDWRDLRSAPVYHRIFCGISGPDTLAPLATILARGVSKFSGGSGSYEFGWYPLEGEAGGGSEFGFEPEIGVDKRATREPPPEQDEIRRLQEMLARERSELSAFLDELGRVECERDEAQGMAKSEKTQSDFLRRRLQQSQAKIYELERQLENVQIPSDLRQFQSWCESRLTGSVVLMKSAYDGVKKSRFHEPSFIYRALLLLRDKYVPMRRKGGDDLRADFEQACQELGLEETPTFTADPSSRDRERFSVPHGGVTTLLDRHLKKGVSYEPKYCFRLYFFWDVASQQVIVGSLPSHL
jgi:hypothetical protein